MKTNSSLYNRERKLNANALVAGLEKGEVEYLVVLGAVLSEFAIDGGRDAVWVRETVAEFYYPSARKSSLKRR